MTKEEANRIWDDTKEGQRQYVMQALMHEAVVRRADALLRQAQGIQYQADKNFAISDAATAAMVLLGMENVETIRDLIHLRAGARCNEELAKLTP